MPPDTGPDLGRHADAAGWVLGTLDHDEAEAFREHLGGCKECEQTVAEFRPVAEALTHPAPAVEPPPELEDRTITAVLRAAAEEHAATRVLEAAPAASQAPKTAGQPKDPAKIIRWPLGDWRVRLAAAVVAAAAIAAAIIVIVLPSPGAGQAAAARIPLQSPTHAAGVGGQAIAYRKPAGFHIVLSVHGLPPSRAGEFYECWYVGPNHSLITAGSFIVGRSGSATLSMWSAADPRQFPIMEVTTEQPGSGARLGKPVLIGHITV